MIVEFVGSTGAGKTSLISKIHSRLASQAVAVTPFDMIATPLGLGGVAHPTLQNIIQETAGFPYFLFALKRHSSFILHTIKLFSRNSKFSILTINNLRSLERKLGVDEIIKRRKNNQIVLVDEGPVLAAHMFVFANQPVTPSEIETFAEYLPLPDLIVYIKAPIETLVGRTLKRSDPPREMGSRDKGLIEDFVRKAATLFDNLMESDKIKGRLLVVENPDLSVDEHDKLADQVVAEILNHRARLASSLS